MKTFCCRFKMDNAFYTSRKISSEELTEKEAMQWAVKTVELEDKLIDIDTVYEVVEDSEE